MAIQIPRPMQSSFPDIRVPQDSPLEAHGRGRSTADTFGAARGLAHQAERMEVDKLETTLQTAIDEEMNALMGEEARLTTELQKVRGKDAFAAAGESLKSFDKYKSEREKNIANPIVKQAVAQRYGRQRMQLEVFGKRYSTAEGERWQDETDQAKWTQNLNAAVANGSPERIAEAIQDTQESMARFAQRKGMAPAMLKLRQDKAASDIHAGVLDRLLATGGDMAAKAYYDANKDALVGNDATRLARIVQNESLLGESRRIALGVFEPKFEGYAVSEGVDAVREVAGAASLKEAIDRGRKATEGKSPELQKEVDQQIQQEWSLIQRGQQEAKKKDLLDATNAIDGGATYDKLNPLLIDRLTHTERNSLKAYADKEPVTDDATWYTLKGMGSREETREKFMNLNLLDPEYLRSLSKTDRRAMMNWQTDLIAKKADALDEAEGFMSTSAVVSNVLKEANITNDKKAAKFTRLVDREVKQWQKDSGKKRIPKDDLHVIIDGLLKDDTYLTIEEDEKKAKEGILRAVGAIPFEDLDKITTYMKERSIPTTPRAILDVHEAMMKDRANQRGK